MQTVILIVALLLAAVGITAYILLSHSIRKMTAELRNINRTQTNAIVRVPIPDRRLEDLAKEIDEALAQKRETMANFQRILIRQHRDAENISHDLRTPLTSVIGYIQLLKDDNLTPEEQKQVKEILLSRAKVLQSLISGYYDLTRLESGEYRLEPHSVHLQETLCEILASFYKDFLNIGVEPSVNIDQKAPPVFADENAVRRVFTNLIQNVLKHNGKNFSVTLKREGSCLITSFANDAPLLSEEDTEHLFERFYTADRMRSGQNTGLGLAIVKELVEGMDGVISASLLDEQLKIEIKWKIKTTGLGDEGNT